MFPKPPHLFRGKGVTDDEPGETYWKVANGIRLTGMPAFKNSLSETEMWQVSADGKRKQNLRCCEAGTHAAEPAAIGTTIRTASCQNPLATGSRLPGPDASPRTPRSRPGA